MTTSIIRQYKPWQPSIGQRKTSSKSYPCLVECSIGVFKDVANYKDTASLERHEARGHLRSDYLRAQELLSPATQNARYTLSRVDYQKNGRYGGVKNDVVGVGRAAKVLRQGVWYYLVFGKHQHHGWEGSEAKLDPKIGDDSVSVSIGQKCVVQDNTYNINSYRHHYLLEPGTQLYSHYLTSDEPFPDTFPLCAAASLETQLTRQLRAEYLLNRLDNLSGVIECHHASAQDVQRVSDIIAAQNRELQDSFAAKDQELQDSFAAKKKTIDELDMHLNAKKALLQRLEGYETLEARVESLEEALKASEEAGKQLKATSDKTINMFRKGNVLAQGTIKALRITLQTSKETSALQETELKEHRRQCEEYHQTQGEPSRKRSMVLDSDTDSEIPLTKKSQPTVIDIPSQSDNEESPTSVNPSQASLADSSVMTVNVQDVYARPWTIS